MAIEDVTWMYLCDFNPNEPEYAGRYALMEKNEEEQAMLKHFEEASRAFWESDRGQEIAAEVLAKSVHIVQ